MCQAFRGNSDQKRNADLNSCRKHNKKTAALMLFHLKLQSYPAMPGINLFQTLDL